MGKRTKQSFFKGRNINGPKPHEELINIPGHKGNANQTTLRFHLTPLRIAITKDTTNNKCWQGCGGKRNPHILLVGTQISTTSMENNMEAPQKTKNRTAK
jgi:hypothetical protein